MSPTSTPLPRPIQPGDQLVSGLVNAVQRGVDPEIYLQANESGIADKELFEVLDRFSTNRQPPIAEYITGRRLGYTHAEVQAAAAHFLSPLYYDKFRSTGATHEEVIALFASSIRNPAWYFDLRTAGATHAQAIELLGQEGLTRLAVTTYTALRNNGATHVQAAQPAKPANVVQRVAVATELDRRAQRTRAASSLPGPDHSRYPLT